MALRNERKNHDQLESDCSPKSPPLSSRRGGARRRGRIARNPDVGFCRGRQTLVPKQHYLIAFSNGDMNNSWRAAFVNSMEQWGKKFKSVGPGVDYVLTTARAIPPNSFRTARPCWRRS